MAVKDVPIMMYGENAKNSISQIIERGLKTGYINLCNLALDKLPSEFVNILPAMFITQPNNGTKFLSDLNEEDEDDEETEKKKKLKYNENSDDNDEQDEDSFSENHTDSLENSDSENEILKYPKETIGAKITHSNKIKKFGSEKKISAIKFATPCHNSSNRSFFMEISSEVLEEEAYLMITRLSLASNLFTVIPMQTCQLENLQVLDVQDNKISILPPEISNLTNLVRFIVSHNQLIEFTPELFKLENLRCLFAHDNKLHKIDKAIGNAMQLEILDLSQNQINVLPESIGNLRRLIRLNLSNNKLEKLPREIGLLEALQTLDLSNNYLNEFPARFGGLQHLEFLSLRKNVFSVLPHLPSCRHLKELHLGGNKIAYIDVEALKVLSNLKVLEIQENKLESLPDEIDTLNNLIRLDIAKNCLEDLPSSISNIKTLKTICLEGNPLNTTFKRLILQHGTGEILRYLSDRAHIQKEVSEKKVSVPSQIRNNESNKNLISTPNILTPDEIHILQFTRTLNYSSKHTELIPDEIFSIGLQYKINCLKLAHNYLSSVPLRLKDVLHLLMELDLSYNQLTEIPCFIGYIPQLRTLDVQANQLTSLPEEVIHLRRLNKLNITNNRFCKIPEVLYQMYWLEMLFAGNNFITEISITGLQKMSNLIVLDLINNDIKHLPFELGYLTHLRRLQLQGNPFRQPRSNVLARGTSYLLEWLRNRIPENE